MLGRTVLYVLGDSHAAAFETIRRRRLLPHTHVVTVRVRGATALGLANPNSQTNALAIFRNALAHIPTSARVLVMLGEVDVGFLVWHLSRERGTDVATEVETSLSRYREFVDSLIAEGRRPELVTVVPPTVADYTTWAGLANARRHITATLEERTALTRAYNAQLRNYATLRGLALVDVEPALLDLDTCMLRDEYRNPDPLDHHLAPEPFARLLAGLLR